MSDTTATEDRPVHHEYNCETGETTLTPMTDEEWEAHKANIAQFDQERAQKEAAEAALKQAVAEHQDPIVQELAARLGI